MGEKGAAGGDGAQRRFHAVIGGGIEISQIVAAKLFAERRIHDHRPAVGIRNLIGIDW